MSYQPQEVVSAEQYRYALTNFRIAHEKVEQQRQQLEQQERQVAALRARIALLEGGHEQGPKISNKGGSSIDDFSIRNAASQLDRHINRWAADVIRAPPAPLGVIFESVLNDIVSGVELTGVDTSPMQVQNLLRHIMSEMIAEGIINCLIVTNSTEANVQLTRIHEHLFSRDPTVACVWRRQTFSAAVEHFTLEMSKSILEEHMPTLLPVISSPNGDLPPMTLSILDSAYEFSRMLHGSGSGTSDAFYRAFVPELGSTLHPRQIELVKRCMKSEHGEPDTVGASIFPGLVKVTRGPQTPGGGATENVQTVVRRAQVICECAITGMAHAPDPYQV